MRFFDTPASFFFLGFTSWNMYKRKQKEKKGKNWRLKKAENRNMMRKRNVSYERNFSFSLIRMLQVARGKFDQFVEVTIRERGRRLKRRARYLLFISCEFSTIRDRLKKWRTPSLHLYCMKMLSSPLRPKFIFFRPLVLFWLLLFQGLYYPRILATTYSDRLVDSAEYVTLWVNTQSFVHVPDEAVLLYIN